MITPDQRRIVEAYVEVSSKASSPDSHLRRVYQAVKTGEWTFEDFTDFVSVVRNEAKISATVNEDLSREERINLLKKKNNNLLRASKIIAPGVLVRALPRSKPPRQDFLDGQVGTVVKGYFSNIDKGELEKGLEDLWLVDFSGLECDVSTPGCRADTPGQHWMRARDLEVVV